MKDGYVPSFFLISKLSTARLYYDQIYILYIDYGSKEYLHGFSRMKEERECMEIREWSV